MSVFQDLWEEKELYIYDLTQGMASSMAPMLGLNFNLEGVWHTAIVVHGKEW